MSPIYFLAGGLQPIGCDDRRQVTACIPAGPTAPAFRERAVRKFDEESGTGILPLPSSSLSAARKSLFLSSFFLILYRSFSRDIPLVPNLLLDRYLNGEHREVWQDLLDLGSAVRFSRTLLQRRERGCYRDLEARSPQRRGHHSEARQTGLPLRYARRRASAGRPPRCGAEVASTTGFAGRRRKRPGKVGAVQRTRFRTTQRAQKRPWRRWPSKWRPCGRRWRPRLRRWPRGGTLSGNRPKSSRSVLSLENEKVFHPPTPGTLDDLDQFEEDFRGPMPISLASLVYEQVGSVDFMGKHELAEPESMAPTARIRWWFFHSRNPPSPIWIRRRVSTERSFTLAPSHPTICIKPIPAAAIHTR